MLVKGKKGRKNITELDVNYKDIEDFKGGENVVFSGGNFFENFPKEYLYIFFVQNYGDKDSGNSSKLHIISGLYIQKSFVKSFAIGVRDIVKKRLFRRAEYSVI